MLMNGIPFLRLLRVAASEGQPSPRRPSPRPDGRAATTASAGSDQAAAGSVGDAMSAAFLDWLMYGGGTA